MKRRILVCLVLLFAVSLLGYAAAMLCLGLSVNRFSALAESQRIQWLRANLSTNSVRVQSDLLSHLAGHEHAPAQRTQNLNRFRRSLDSCERCHHPPHLQAKLDAVRSTFESYNAMADRVFSSTDPAERKALEHETLQFADRFVMQSTNMADLAGQHLATRRTDAAAAVHSAWIILSVTLVVLLAGGGVVALHLQRRLTGPMEALLKGVEGARDGTVSEDFPHYADAEFRQLHNAFRQAYGDLSRAKESVLQAEKLAAIGTLAAGIAHEVLNPTASISSIAQVMRRQTDSKDLSKQTELIISETKRISNVVGELLSFSRPAQANTYARLDVRRLLEHATTLIQFDRRTRDIEVVCRFDPDTPSVRGDEQKLILVFTNIMINALDAMQSLNGRSRSLTIATHQTHDHVEIEFVDQGIGMTEDQLASAFDPFFTTKEPDCGTGLGLWICFEVVQRHGGTIRLSSIQGEGTTVRVALPMDSVLTAPADSSDRV